MGLPKKILSLPSVFNMEVVAQLVRASDCGSEGRGFDPRHPPRKFLKKVSRNFGTLFLLSSS